MFYGWYIIAAGVLLSIYNSASFTYGFTAFIAPIAATFGWSYTQITLAMSLRGLETGMLNPVLGMAVDRWPARRLVLIGIGLAGLGVLGISQATNLVMFYLGFVTMGLGTSLAIFMVPQTTMARWFNKDLGKASALLTMGVAIGGLLLPVLVRAIDTYGWQTCLVVLAAGMWILGIPLSFVFRNRPEEYGLLPDGKPHGASGVSGDAKVYDSGSDVKEVLKTRAFWYFGMASALQLGTTQAVMTHVMPYLNSLGVARSTASIVTMLIALVSILARLPFGWLADVFPIKYVVVLSNALTSIALFIFWLIDGSSFGLMLLFVIVFGVAISGSWSLRPPLIRKYFGIKRFGTIFGAMSIFITAGTIVLTPVAAWVFDALGYYDPIWLVFSALALIGVILLLAAPLPSGEF